MEKGLAQLELARGATVLVYGIGNLGRRDDGLGIRLVQRLEAEFPAGSGMAFEGNYQLGLEDCLLLAGFDVVIFVDATREASAPFSLRGLHPAEDFAFTTHALGFSTVLALCEKLYCRRPQTFLLAIPGYEWEIAEGLSAGASRNLEHAYSAIKNLLMDKHPGRAY